MQHPDSYWAETGNPAPVVPTISGDQKADVIIISAGFTGSSAAYHLSQAGIDAIVVDAEDVGWGASGRNGGMLPPRYKKGFASLHANIHEAVETIVSDCALDCGFARAGQITPAHSDAHLASLERDCAWISHATRTGQDG